MKDIKNAIAHLKQHQKYPATRQDLVDECMKLSDFSEEDKMWFEEHLPEGTYESAEDVIRALGWKSEKDAMMEADHKQSMHM